MIGLTRVSTDSSIPIFQRVIETAQGGFTLDRADASTAGDVIPAGTPVTFNEATRLAKIDNTVNENNVKGLLYFPVTVPAADEPEAEVAVVIRGTVYENRIVDVNGDAVVISANMKAALPNIIFSKSF